MKPSSAPIREQRRLALFLVFEQRFLPQVHREVVRLGVDRRCEAIELLDLWLQRTSEVSEQAVEELAEELAAALGSTPQERAGVRARFDQYKRHLCGLMSRGEHSEAAAADSDPRPEDTPVHPGQWETPPIPLTEEALPPDAPRGTSRQKITRKRPWLALVAGLVLAFSGIWSLRILRQEAPPSNEPVAKTDAADVAPPTSPPVSRSGPQVLPRPGAKEETLGPLPHQPGSDAGDEGRQVMLWSSLFLLLAGFVLHGANRRGDERSKQGGAASVQPGQRALVEYSVPPPLPLDPRILDSVATALCRLTRSRPGGVLDVEGTLNRRCRQSVSEPLFEPEQIGHEVLVLIDLEGAPKSPFNPWLGGIEGVLDRLAAHGVPLVRAYYRKLPDRMLTGVERQRPSDNDPLVFRGHPSYRHTGEADFLTVLKRWSGSPLILFSRALPDFPTETDQDADERWQNWITALRTNWPLRAWIDLSAEVRDPGTERLAVHLEELGLARFSWTDEGLEGLCRYFLLEGQVERQRRRRLSWRESTQIEMGLKHWLLAANEVPDGRWSLLQYLRTHPELPELSGIPHHGYEAVLVDYLRERIRRQGRLPGDRFKHSGRALDVPPTVVAELKRELPESVNEADQNAFVRRVRRVLVERLTEARRLVESLPERAQYESALQDARVRSAWLSSERTPGRAIALVEEIKQYKDPESALASLNVLLERDHEVDHATGPSEARRVAREREALRELRRPPWGQLLREKGTWWYGLSRTLVLGGLLLAGSWSGVQIEPLRRLAGMEGRETWIGLAPKDRVVVEPTPEAEPPPEPTPVPALVVAKDTPPTPRPVTSAQPSRSKAEERPPTPLAKRLPVEDTSLERGASEKTVPTQEFAMETGTPAPAPGEEALEVSTPTAAPERRSAQGASEIPEAQHPPVPAGKRVLAASKLRPAVRVIPVLPRGFKMGAYDWDDLAYEDEKPQHQVVLSRFAMFETEVTQEQFKAVEGEAPWEARGVQTKNDHPAIYVSWFDATRYANKLSVKEGLTKCYKGKEPDVKLSALDCSGYRLPTEAEWEYAARAGTHNRYAGTNAVDKVCDFGNVGPDFECDDGVPRVGSVRRRAENGWGLYDMTGNVWEWVGDWYGMDYYASSRTRDPPGPSAGSFRVLRGGSWGNDPRFARVAVRSGWPPGYRINDVGFRLSRSWP